MGRIEPEKLVSESLWQCIGLTLSSRIALIDVQRSHFLV